MQVRDLLVAWRRNARGSSSGMMPMPSSSTLIRRTPPASSRTVTWVAPASSALSTRLTHHRGGAFPPLRQRQLADRFVGKFARMGRRAIGGGIHRGICGAPGLLAGAGDCEGDSSMALPEWLAVPPPRHLARQWHSAAVSLLGSCGAEETLDTRAWCVVTALGLTTGWRRPNWLTGRQPRSSDLQGQGE